MFKPIRWNTFPRDFLRIQIGFFLFGLAITLMIRGNMGRVPGQCWKWRWRKNFTSRSAQ